MNVLQKFVWKADCAQQFIESMHSGKSKEQLRLASSLIDVDINEALQSFNDCLKQNAEYMKRSEMTSFPLRHVQIVQTGLPADPPARARCSRGLA